MFSFTDRERNGTIVLLVLILLVSVFIFLQSVFISLPKEDFSKFDAFIASLEVKENSDSIFDEDKKMENYPSPFPSVAEQAGTHSVYHTKELFNFNPNGLSEDDWVRLGLSPAQARCVKKYEASGGKFQTKSDVKKLFVISAERYAELEPFIVLPDQLPQGDSLKKYADNKFQKPKKPAVIELNTADSSDLVSVNGIGPAFAKRILDYRERLGGFHSIDQLTEVFGIDAEKFGAIKNSVKADSSYIRKINVNTAGISDFKKLPYISPGVAAALVNYRKSHGNYKSVGEIRGCVLVTADLYRKISPYLTV